MESHRVSEASLRGRRRTLIQVCGCKGKVKGKDQGEIESVASG